MLEHSFAFGDGHLMHWDLEPPHNESPERRLVIATLYEAVKEFQYYYGASSPRLKSIWQEARDWLLSKDTDWPWACENLCAHLGIEASEVRRLSLQWLARRRAMRTPRRRNKVEGMGGTASPAAAA